jgi:hypothetical protein
MSFDDILNNLPIHGDIIVYGHIAQAHAAPKRSGCTVRNDAMVFQGDKSLPHRVWELARAIGKHVQRNVHAQLNRALKVHAQNILQIEIAEQFFMREPSLGTDSVHASAKRFHFPKNEHLIH